MATYISQRLVGYRKHVIASIALCFSGMLLLIPQVLNVFIYFCPLLLSTALFVTALLSLRSFISSTEVDQGYTYNVEEDFPVVAEENLTDTIPDAPVENKCLFECVKELHESGLLMYESMFKLEVLKQPNKKSTEDNDQQIEEINGTSSNKESSNTEGADIL